MSLRTVLISIIVAGLLAGMVLLSQSIGDGSDTVSARTRTIGVDAVAIHEIRVHAPEYGTQVAVKAAGSVDDWELKLDGTDRAGWKADSTRIRTVLRALASSVLTSVDADEIGEASGTLSLIDRDGLVTELRFAREATGGLVRVEVVTRGDDGIATDRWFGRIERSLRDSLIGDGLSSWRSLDLFQMTIPDVTSAYVRAGENKTSLVRTNAGWQVEPWNIGTDSAMVQGMLGLSLGLNAIRYYDDSVYSDTLTGLDSPLAEIRIGTKSSDGSPASIVIGSGVDASGKEVFARYTSASGSSAVIAVGTEGLNRLTASPIAYIQRTVAGVDQTQIAKIEIFGSNDELWFACSPAADSWVRETDGNTTPATPSEIDAIKRLAHTLTREESVRVYTTDPGFTQGVSKAGSIVLSLRDGRKLRYGAGVESFGGSIRLHLMLGQSQPNTLVWVMGSTEAAGSGAWIAAMGSRSSN
jgi:Domain of unknown function (DUF4340)